MASGNMMEINVTLDNVSRRRYKQNN